MTDGVVFAGQEFAAAAAEESKWTELDRTSAGDMVRVIEYGADNGLFRTSVISGEIKLVTFTQSTHEPIFGIDVADLDVINQVSERMAVTLD
jgi:hypothetical protein